MQQITHLDYDAKGEKLLVVGHLTDREQLISLYNSDFEVQSKLELKSDDHVQKAGLFGGDKALLLSETVSLYNLADSRAIFSENIMARDFSFQPLGEHVALGLADAWSLLDL